jgi:hypothetical protein
MAKMAADEHFPFTSVGPYTISKSEDGIHSECLQENVKTKRDAISTGKKFLANGIFKFIIVTDSQNRVIFQQERFEGARFFATDIRFNAFVRLLLNSEKMTQEVRNQTCYMLAKEFRSKISVAAGESWSEVEDEALSFLYTEIGLTDYKTIGILLDRSDSAVGNRVKRLNLLPKANPRPSLFGKG